jgi:hypothetical protein
MDPGLAWCWHTPVILALQKLRQEDHKCETSQGCLVRSYLKPFPIPKKAKKLGIFIKPSKDQQ